LKRAGEEARLRVAMRNLVIIDGRMKAVGHG
jgi:hypothetical protein